jgi:hypothetical protein
MAASSRPMTMAGFEYHRHTCPSLEGMIHDQVYQKTIDSMMTSELRDRTMLYQRSLEIEQRLESVLQIIRRGGYSTPSIANELACQFQRSLVPFVLCVNEGIGFVPRNRQTDGVTGWKSPNNNSTYPPLEFAFERRQRYRRFKGRQE